MSTPRSLAPLVAGLILVLIGLFFLAVNVYGMDVRWLHVFRFGIPLLFVWLGLTKLVRHFTWNEVQLEQEPGKASLLSGIFWTAIGGAFLVYAAGGANAFWVLGSFWPAILVLFGIGKIIDFYRLKGRLQFRTAELVGVVFVVLFGITVGRVHSIQRDLPDFSHAPMNWPWERDDRWRSHFESRKDIPAEGVKSILVANTFGDVSVDAGTSNQIQVELRTAVSARERGDADRRVRDVGITAELKDGALTIGTDTKNRAEDEDLRIRTDLRIIAPESLALTIRNNHGRTTVNNFKAPIDVENAYGHVQVSSIAGKVLVKNRFEAVRLRAIEGDVVVENRRGDIRIEDVKGNARVTTDREGITLERIQGTAEVANYFGDVRLRSVTGPVNVKSPGSTVHLTGVEKDVYAENSHERLTAEDVAGNLEVNTSYSNLNVSNIKGRVTIRASNSQVGLKNLDQGVVVQGKDSKISLSDVAGAIQVATSLRPVTLNHFQGPAQVQNEYGEILLEPSVPLAGALIASNRNGDINLRLPESVSCKLSAQAPGGEVVSDFERRVERVEHVEKTQMIEQTIGGGKTEVRLQTTYSKIHIRKGE